MLRCAIFDLPSPATKRVTPQAGTKEWIASISDVFDSPEKFCKKMQCYRCASESPLILGGGSGFVVDLWVC